MILSTANAIVRPDTVGHANVGEFNGGYRQPMLILAGASPVQGADATLS